MQSHLHSMTDTLEIPQETVIVSYWCFPSRPWVLDISHIHYNFVPRLSVFFEVVIISRLLLSGSGSGLSPIALALKGG